MMPIVAALVSVVLTLSHPPPAKAGEDVTAVIAETQYFTVTAFEDINVPELLEKLNYDYFLQVDTFLMNGRTDVSPKDLLVRNLDAVYREVENILGLQVLLFRGTIHICRNKADVSAEFRKIYGMDFQERSFYIFDGNTVFISYEDLTLGMLGHEIAHAVISGYFAVPPPAKVQEVLAGYVEYSLRKVTTH